MQFSLIEMWHTMGLPAKIVGAFLLTMGLASLTAFIERLIALRRSRAESARFAAEAADDLQAGQVDAVMTEAAKYPRGHLPRLVRAGLTAEELAEILPSVDALIVRSHTVVSSEAVKRGARLRVIARAGVGVDNIDVEAATHQGIASGAFRR